MKRLEPVNIKIDTNMDADDYGDRIVKCVRDCNPDTGVINLVKVDIGDLRIPFDQFSHFMTNIKNMFIEAGAKNCVFIPIGKQPGIKDITIDYIKVINDEVESKT